MSIFNSLLDFLGRSLSFFYDLIPNYGVAIILLTVATRVVMLPLTIKQTRSMQEMQKLQPELKRLQAKYKGGDRQKLNEEMMKLYKEHHVNPLGGCLPLVLQLPVFFALYRTLAGCGAHVAKGHACAVTEQGVKYLPHVSALRTAINTGHAGFLGMNLGLSPVTALKAHGGLLHAAPYFVMVLIMVFTTWYQQKQMMAVSSGQQAAQMQMMGKIMPLILGVFSLNLPAGVSIYWVASNIWTIGQQRFILGKPTADAGAAATKDAGPAPGGGRLGLRTRDAPEDGRPALGNGKGRKGSDEPTPTVGKPRNKPRPAAEEVEDAVVADAVVDEAAAARPAKPNGVPGNGKPKRPAQAGGNGTANKSGNGAAKGGATPGVAAKGGAAPAGKNGEPIEAKAPAKPTGTKQPASSGRPAGARGQGGQGAARGGSNARKKRRR